MRVFTFLYTVIILVGLVIVSPVSAELLIHYDFEKGDLEDASGNNNVGEIIGDAERVTGRVGMGLKLDGEDDYVLLSMWTNGGPLTFTHNAFTERSIAIWIKADDVNGDYDIFDEGGWAQGLAVGISAGKLRFSTRRDQAEATAAVEYTKTDWHHIAAVFQEGRLRLYLDGEQVAAQSAPYNQVNAHSDGGAVGANRAADAFGNIMQEGGSNVDEPGFFFKGIVDEFYYYDNAITEEEISALYQLGAAVKVEGKLATKWGKIKV